MEMENAKQKSNHHYKQRMIDNKHIHATTTIVMSAL